MEHKDCDGLTPLVSAIKKQHLECVNLLLAAGANPFVQVNTLWVQGDPEFEDYQVLVKRAKLLYIFQKFQSFNEKRKKFSTCFPYGIEFKVQEYFEVHKERIKRLEALTKVTF